MKLKNKIIPVSIEHELHDEDNKLPVIVVGSKILGGEIEIKRNLAAEIAKLQPSRVIPVTKDVIS
ncbi:MAG: hypothetical protein QME68_02635 [Elusimicrobiota bacterium]|nr:hypothetical protein [Elusimicrobiota bacterium]